MYNKVHTGAMLVPIIRNDKVMNRTPSSNEVIESTRRWLEKAVIGLNLCPFAKAVYAKKQVRYVVSTAETASALQQELAAELQTLQQSSPEIIDTTLLIHPWVLTDFLDYNDFLDVANATVAKLRLEGSIQVASFHPQYQFADAATDDISNFTNRSPYPILHLLREESIGRAVAAIPDASDIFEKNIETMRRLGRSGWDALDIYPRTTSVDS